MAYGICEIHNRRTLSNGQCSRCLRSGNATQPQTQAHRPQVHPQVHPQVYPQVPPQLPYQGPPQVPYQVPQQFQYMPYHQPQAPYMYGPPMASYPYGMPAYGYQQLVYSNPIFPPTVPMQNLSMGHPHAQAAAFPAQQAGYESSSSEEIPESSTKSSSKENAREKARKKRKNNKGKVDTKGRKEESSEEDSSSSSEVVADKPDEKPRSAKPKSQSAEATPKDKGPVADAPEKKGPNSEDPAAKPKSKDWAQMVAEDSEEEKVTREAEIADKSAYHPGPLIYRPLDLDDCDLLQSFQDGDIYRVDPISTWSMKMVEQALLHKFSGKYKSLEADITLRLKLRKDELVMPIKPHEVRTTKAANKGGKVMAQHTVVGKRKLNGTGNKPASKPDPACSLKNPDVWPYDNCRRGHPFWLGEMRMKVYPNTVCDFCQWAHPSHLHSYCINRHEVYCEKYSVDAEETPCQTCLKANNKKKASTHHTYEHEMGAWYDHWQDSQLIDSGDLPVPEELLEFENPHPYDNDQMFTPFPKFYYNPYDPINNPSGFRAPLKFQANIPDVPADMRKGIRCGLMNSKRDLNTEQLWSAMKHSMKMTYVRGGIDLAAHGLAYSSKQLASLATHCKVSTDKPQSGGKSNDKDGNSGRGRVDEEGNLHIGTGARGKDKPKDGKSGESAAPSTSSATGGSAAKTEGTSKQTVKSSESTKAVQWRVFVSSSTDPSRDELGSVLPDPDMQFRHFKYKSEHRMHPMVYPRDNTDALSHLSHFQLYLSDHITDQHEEQFLAFLKDQEKKLDYAVRRFVGPAHLNKVLKARYSLPTIQKWLKKLFEDFRKAFQAWWDVYKTERDAAIELGSTRSRMEVFKDKKAIFDEAYKAYETNICNVLRQVPAALVNLIFWANEDADMGFQVEGKEAKSILQGGGLPALSGYPCSLKRIAWPQTYLKYLERLQKRKEDPEYVARHTLSEYIDSSDS